jgi:hypothetical protein
MTPEHFGGNFYSLDGALFTKRAGRWLTPDDKAATAAQSKKLETAQRRTTENESAARYLTRWQQRATASRWPAAWDN